VPKIRRIGATPDDAGPLDAAEFAWRLDLLGPFEAEPVLAVAVSGGADSLALIGLADPWARARGGKAVALIVDHGLRPESGAEARRVRDALASRGIEAHILAWSGPKPARGVQAAARAARYRLLEEWCRREGVLHLLLAHHAGDQAETIAMRRARGGDLGLAGMAAIAETRDLRRLRPLLGVAKARLVATVQAAGQGWIEDPSNRDPRSERARVRAGLRESDARRLLALGRRTGRRRAETERAAAALLARHLAARADGSLAVARVAFRSGPVAPRRAALAALLQSVGATPYPPDGRSLAALLQWLSGPATGRRTLAHCRIAAGAAAADFRPENRPVRSAPAARPLAPAPFAVSPH
jgi:tRNA(Ile)-lysidine synthase